jgi:hypothetical protein
VLSQLLDLPVASGIIQINRVTQPGATGYHRLAFPAIFGGSVAPFNYLLVDDSIGQGGTLANLRRFVEAEGGTVVGATVLTGKEYSAKLRPEEETLINLRRKHGEQLELKDGGSLLTRAARSSRFRAATVGSGLCMYLRRYVYRALCVVN